MKQEKDMSGKTNHRPGVRAGWRTLFASQCPWPRATQAERWSFIASTAIKRRARVLMGQSKQSSSPRRWMSVGAKVRFNRVARSASAPGSHAIRLRPCSVGTSEPRNSRRATPQLLRSNVLVTAMGQTVGDEATSLSSRVFTRTGI